MATKEFPALKTERLLLRRIVAEDVADVFAIFSDPEVTRHYDLATLTKRQQAAALIHQHESQFEKDASIRWGIALKGSPRLIGSGGFGWQRWNHSATIGYEVAREFWNQGIATEAIRAMAIYAFEKMSINRIQALITMENAASVRVLKKLDFQEEGILREWGFWNDAFRDMRSFSLLRKDAAAWKQSA